MRPIGRLTIFGHGGRGVNRVGLGAIEPGERSMIGGYTESGADGVSLPVGA
jgi:hypothetical protein